MGRLRSGLTAAFTLLSLLALSPAASADSGRRIGARPRIPPGASALGALPGATSVHATVALVPRDPAALAAYAAAVSTPGSSVYHRYLGLGEFRRRFGPTPAQIDEVRAALQAEGLSPGAVSPSGLALDVSASAATAGQAFSTSFERYRLPDGQTGFANTAAPAVDSRVAGLIQGVIGLDTLAVRSPQALGGATARGGAGPSPRASAANAARPCSSAAQQTSAGAYTADQIASAYGLGGLYSAGDLGSGVTVALYELEPYRSSDISTYQSCYGTSATVTNVNVDGGPGTGAGSGEAALDIEDVIGLAPQAAIRVYQGPNTGQGAYDAYSQIVQDDTAQVVSTSWGLCESLEGQSAAAAENTLFEEAAVQGQSIFAASGDSGSDDCGTSTGGPTVDDPASQPFVTGVGGTSLSGSAPGSPEAVWNDSFGAGGGGASSLWPAQSYQSGFSHAQSAVTCGGAGTACREVPDVSADADPNTGYIIYWRGRWTVIGGTSAAAPTWAALVALADASASCAGSPVGFANAALYGAAAAGYGSDFHDVTSGTNAFDGVSGWSAGTGYDMASGLGTPNGASLVASLCGGSAGPGASPSSPTNQAPSTTSSTTATTTTTPTTTAAPEPPTHTTPPPVTSPARSTVTLARPAGQAGRVGVRVRLQLSARDSRGLSLSYRASGLPRGLSLDRSTGRVTGTPARPGSSTVTVSAVDVAGSGASARFAWIVAGRPRVVAKRLRRSSPGRIRLTLAIDPGTGSPAVSRISLAGLGRTLALSGRPAPALSVRTLSGRRLRGRVRAAHGVLSFVLRRPSSGAATLRLVLTGRLPSPSRRRVRVAITLGDVRGGRAAVSAMLVRR